MCQYAWLDFYRGLGTWLYLWGLKVYGQSSPACRRKRHPHAGPGKRDSQDDFFNADQDLMRSQILRTPMLTDKDNLSHSGLRDGAPTHNRLPMGSRGP